MNELGGSLHKMPTDLVRHAAMALADNVAHFLIEHGGQGFCDQCLATHLGNPSTASYEADGD